GTFDVIVGQPHALDVGDEQTHGPAASDAHVLDDQALQGGRGGRIRAAVALVPARHDDQALAGTGAVDAGTHEDRIDDGDVFVRAVLEVDVEAGVELVGRVHAAAIHGHVVEYRVRQLLGIETLDPVAVER